MPSGYIVPLCAGLLASGPAAHAEMFVPNCQTPSMSAYTQLFEEVDGQFAIFVDINESDRSNQIFHLVDCDGGESLTVLPDQHFVFKYQNRPAARRVHSTLSLMTEAVLSESTFSFRSLRDELRANGGDGTLNSLPADYCGCELLSEIQPGDTQ